MLWIIAVVFLVLWGLGVATSHTLGGFLHLLLVLGITAALIGAIQDS